MARSSLLRSLAIVCLFTFSIVFAQEEENTSEKPESSKEALLLYAEAAGFQNNEQFDLAGREWAKFVEKHANDSRAVEARYNLAVCQLQQKNFKSAVENLSKVVVDADDTFERLEDAYLNLGWCQYSVALENQPEYFAKASDTFSQLLKKYPKGDFRDQALFFGGESLYLQGKFKEATESYGQLVEKHTDSDLHSDAMYALGVTQEDRRLFEDAGKIYSAFLKTYPDHDLATEVRMRQAETILQTGEFGEAAKIFREVSETQGFRSVDHARFRLAFCLAEQANRLGASAKDDSQVREKQAKGYVEAAKIFGSVATEMKESPYANDAAIAAGRAYYRAKEFDDATRWFKSIKDSDSPHAPEAAHWMARILLDQKKPSDARDVVASVMKSAQEHPFLVSLKLDDADALYQAKPTQKDSVAAYFKIYEDHKDHRLAPKALYNAAYGAMEVGEYKSGLEYADQFSARFAKHPLAPEVQKVVAECKLQLGDHADAAEVYKELAASGDKDGTKFELRRGLSLFLKKNYDDAIPVLEKVYTTTASKDEKAEAAYWLGRSYAGKTEYPQAIDSYQKSQSANPAWDQADEVLLNLARAQRRTGKVKEAINTATKLVSTYTDSEVLDQAYYRLGEFSYALNDYKNAIRHYTKTLSDFPDSKLVPFSLYGRGWSSLRNGDIDSAMADFDLLQKEHKGHELSDQTIYARGMAQHQSGRHAAALETVQAYFETEPTGSSRSDALYLEGLCKVGMKKHAEAIKVFDQLLKENDSYGSSDKVLYELAWAHKNVKDDANALATFNKLMKASPNSPLAAEAFYHKGEDLYQKKEYQEAADSYASARSLAKAKDLQEKATYKLGWAQYQAGSFRDALASFDQQLKINDKSNLAADAEFMKGECLFKQGDFTTALEAYRQAKSKPSKNETMQVLTLLHGGQSAAQVKDWTTSAEWIGELLQKFPKSAYAPQAIYERGWAQRNLGQLDPALESFKRLSTTSRNELGARARFMIGEVHFEKKDYNAAILEFRRVMFGYGAEKAPDGIKRWQAKAAFEAGRCASVLAGQESDIQRRTQLIEGAKGFFQYVAEKHPSAPEASTAKEQLQRLLQSQPRRGNRISNRRTQPGV